MPKKFGAKKVAKSPSAKTEPLPSKKNQTEFCNVPTCYGPCGFPLSTGRTFCRKHAAFEDDGIPETISLSKNRNPRDILMVSQISFPVKENPEKINNDNRSEVRDDELVINDFFKLPFELNELSEVKRKKFKYAEPDEVVTVENAVSYEDTIGDVLNSLKLRVNEWAENVNFREKVKKLLVQFKTTGLIDEFAFSRFKVYKVYELIERQEVKESGVKKSNNAIQKSTKSFFEMDSEN